MSIEGSICFEAVVSYAEKRLQEDLQHAANALHIEGKRAMEGRIDVWQEIIKEFRGRE